MKAIVATAEGAQLQEVPSPAPSDNEILVRVKAASLNRADLAGLAAKDGKVIGMEWAGEVVEVGREATSFKVGDRVMCTGSGAYAEYAVTDWGRACLISNKDLPFEQATILTLALQAMHDAIVTHGQLTKGDAVLIHGASSGVGLMGLQIAKLLGARVVIGTSTNAERRARLKDFGADHAVDPSDPGWVEAVLAATDGKGVDVIVDQVTGAGFKQTMQTAALRGRIVNLGRLGGAGGQFDFNIHALKRLSYIGVTFRTRSVEEIRILNARMLADLSQAIGAGQLRLPIDRQFPLAQAAEALARMNANAHFGKIVLTV
jgi:NADPH2:quinone reductase